MPVQNAEVAATLDKYADLLEIEGANQFRVRAYRAASRNISSLPVGLADILREGKDLAELPGTAAESSS
jgi:DNA polymerase (family X)